MKAYGITYRVRGKDRLYTVNIDARDIQSAKRKLGRKHGYKDGRMIQIVILSVIGHF